MQVPKKSGNVEWGHLISFKCTFKCNDKHDGYESRIIILTLRGKRGRTHYTLGTLSFDLSFYVQDMAATLHLPFESGSRTLPSDTEFCCKVRVVPLDAASANDTLDMSTTMQDDDDDDDDDEDDANRVDEDSIFSKLPKRRNRNKFILTPEELAVKGPAQGMAPALQIQSYEEEIALFKKRAVQDKRDTESRHKQEVNKLQQQIRGINLEHEARIRELEEELKSAQQAISSGTIAGLRKQLEEGNEQLLEKTQRIEMLRLSCEESSAKLMEATTDVARVEAALQRATKELTMYTAAENLKREEQTRRRKTEGKDSKLGRIGDSLELSSSSSSIRKEIRSDSLDSSKSKTVARALVGTSEIPATGSPLLEKRRRRPTELARPEESISPVRVFSLIMLCMALGFVIMKAFFR